MRGRKPAPTMLANLRGNPGKRKRNAAEPKPVGDLSEPPEWLTDAQREGWQYVLRHSPPGLLKRLDRGLLAVWVVAEDLYRQAAVELSKTGLVEKAPNTGAVVQSPYLSIVNRQAQILIKVASELGFTPASRPRIVVEPQTPGDAADTKSGMSLEEFIASAPPRPRFH